MGLRHWAGWEREVRHGAGAARLRQDLGEGQNEVVATAQEGHAPLPVTFSQT